MELTKEIKLKVFAQYLGQQIRLTEGLDRKLIAVGGIDDEPYITMRLGKAGAGQFVHSELLQGSSEKLILKQLSDITDEHAIDCINILLGTKDSMYEDWDGNIQRRWLVQIKHELRDNLGSTMRIAGFKSVYSLTQYLQSKGYDIPNYFLEGKTLTECGMAVEQ